MATWDDGSSTWDDATESWDDTGSDVTLDGPAASSISASGSLTVVGEESDALWDDLTEEWDDSGAMWDAGIASTQIDLAGTAANATQARPFLTVAWALAGKAPVTTGSRGIFDAPPVEPAEDWDDSSVEWDAAPVNWDTDLTVVGPEPEPEPEPPGPTDPEVPIPPAPIQITTYTTPLPPQFIQDLIFGPAVQRRRRVDIYRADAVTPWMLDAPLLDGNVSVDQGRAERRMADITLDNEERRLDHHPGGFWYDKVIKIFHGVETPTAIWETQIGEFLIDDIREAHFPHHVSVKGRDYTKKLMNSKIPAAMTFPAGRDVAQAVRTIATGTGTEEIITKFNLDDDGQVLGISVTFERNVTRWEAIQKIADAYSLEVFFDRFGFLVLRPYRDPMVAPVVFTFLTGVKGNLASYEKSSNDSQLFNHVVVTGAATANRIPVFGEAENNNPASATSIINMRQRRTLPIEDPLVVSTEQAQRRAAQLLKVAGLASYEINLGAILAPWLDVGDAIEFIDPRAVVGQPTRFLLSTLSYPIALGPMQANGKRLSIVTSTGGEQPPPTEPPPTEPPPPNTVAPVVTAHPVALLTAVAGTNFTFTSLATGTPTPTVQWQWSTSTSGPWNNIANATSNSLTESATTAKDNNYYRAVFTNSAGTAASNPGRLDVSNITTPPTTVSTGKARLAWYWLEATPPSDAVINAWAPQVALVVLNPKLVSTRDKIKAANPQCRVIAAKSLWTTVSTETAAPFTTALNYNQALTNSWLLQDNVTTPPPPSGSFPATVQAETFTLVNPAPDGMMVSTSGRAGFQGSGFISRWYQDGERVEFTYVSDVARTAALKFRHAQGNVSQTASRNVYTNGVLRGTVTFPATGANWTVATWVADGSRPSIDVPLTAGSNTIRIEVPGAGDGIELDAVEITTAVGAEPPPPPPPPGGGTGTGYWEIDAQGRFLDPLGRRTQLIGANAGIQHYAMTSQLNNGQWAFANSTDFRQWGWNCVRLFCVADYAVGGEGAPGPVSLQQLVDRIIAVHNDLATHEIVTIYSDWGSGSTGVNPAPGASANADEVTRRLIDAIGDSPWLWIGHVNEPFAWPGHPQPGWVTWNNYLYNLIRTRPKGAKTMFVADASSTGQDAATCVSTGDWAAFATGKHHVALGWHLYMAGRTAASIESERTVLKNANVPFIIGEYGYQPNNPGAACCGGTWNDQRAGSLKVINEWTAQGESHLVWHATGDNHSHTLRNPGAPYNEYGNSLNEMGQALWNQRTRSKQY
jgi:hypothetical protein